MTSFKDRVRQTGAELGIDKIGFATAADLGESGGLDDWLRRSYHGTMGWMARLRELRLDPRRVLEGTRTVLTVAVNYFHPAMHEGAPGTARISRYAWGGDYHRIVKARLWRLVDRLRGEWPGLRARAFVDTGPVLEKAWAHRSGLGWVGKNGNVLTRRLGSWVFLGEILLDRAIEPDPPATDHCGTCTRCIDACPTAAIVAPAVVDSRRCISYLTIELRGAIDPSLRSGMGDWVFGCDVCQDVCPWNKFQAPTSDPRFAPRSGNAAPDLLGMAALGERDFHRRFAGSNVRRARWAGFLRNVMVALGNHAARTGGEQRGRARDALRAGLDHPEPLVREHAAWGLGRIDDRAPLRARVATERDPGVRDEIEAALGAAPMTG